ncbi:MAG: 16S rRNA (guanine(966)-N(2))-methyltransferase RsmD [Arenicella sp.]
MRNKKNGNSTYAGEIRIIGGQWRSRKLMVPDVDGLRPTTDRVRETLFNWLQPYIHGARCLDVCAGSGALGFEALSRGAKHVDFVDKHPRAIEVIKRNAHSLGMSADQQCSIHKGSIMQFLQENTEKAQYDIVFVDPPFDLQMHEDIFTALQEVSLLDSNGLIYCEKPLKEALVLPDAWEWIKEKKTKNVVFGLIAV